VFKLHAPYFASASDEQPQHTAAASSKSSPEHCSFALVQRSRDTLLHEVHVAAESMMRHQKNEHAVGIQALGDLVQRNEAVQQSSGALLERSAFEAALRRVPGVHRGEVREVAWRR
jgi:hypothetical protein